MGAVMRWARPRRLRPAQARKVACDLAVGRACASRVSTLPRKLNDLEIGPQPLQLRGAAHRGRADVRRPAADRAIDCATGLISASRGILARQQGGDRQPVRQCAGMSFIEWTARSIAPGSSASSISLVNRPLPPISASGRSRMRSPVVVMVDDLDLVRRRSHARR